MSIIKVNRKNSVNIHMLPQKRCSKNRLAWLSVCLAYPWIVYAASTVKTEHTAVRLLSEQQQIQPSRPFWLALELKPESGWHTYWKNPGDAGKATAINWSLPPGLKAGPLLWPYPQRIRSGSLVSFGYMGTVHLLTEISGSPPVGADTIQISAAADWLVCEEICIPESAALNLNLPVAAGNENTRALAPIFDATRALLPKTANWTARYIYKNNQLVFEAPLKVSRELESLLFFPVEDNLIENSANQSFLLGKNAVRVSVNAGYKEQIGPFQGVLVLKHPQNAVAEALEFSAQPVQQLPELVDTQSGSAVKQTTK